MPVTTDTTEYFFDIEGGVDTKRSFDLAALSSEPLLIPSYMHREGKYKVVDLFPELLDFENSRIAAYYFWQHGRMQQFTKASNCGGYMPRKDSYDCRGSGRHHGIDLSCFHDYRTLEKDQIVVPLPFTVIWVGTQNGYGKRIELMLNGSKVLLMFNHLETIEVEAGKQYNAFTIIGREGHSGTVQDHLHLEAADGTVLANLQDYIDSRRVLPHASTLYNIGALRCPWYFIDFSLHTKPKK